MKESAQPASGTFSVLHMDDDPAMREITSLMLKHKGHTVVSCCNVDATVAAYPGYFMRCWFDERLSAEIG